MLLLLLCMGVIQESETGQTCWDLEVWEEVGRLGSQKESEGS